MLKLIVSRNNLNTEIASFPEEMIEPISHEPFTSKVYPKGPFLYIMSVQDLSHCLECEITLEVETSKMDGDSSIVICHFPEIHVEQLHYFIDKDENLFDIIMTQFQMKILEQLLSFCANQYASKLIIYTDDASAEDLKIYREFLSCGEEAEQQDEINTEMVIPINQHIYADWTTYMEQVFLTFRQTLWQGQRSNQAIRKYLKTHPLG